MVDFRKLGKPKSMKDQVKKLSERVKKQEEANRFMVKRLFELLDNDKIDSEYDQQFITNCAARVYGDIPLSEKQQTYLDKIFHNKY